MGLANTMLKEDLRLLFLSQPGRRS